MREATVAGRREPTGHALPRHVRVLRGGLVLCPLLVAAAAVAAPDRLARAIRAVLVHFTALNALVLVAVAAGLAFTASLIGRVGRGRSGMPVRARVVLDELGRALDGVRWPVAVGGIALLVGAGWYVLGRATTLPHIFDDELIHAEQARIFARTNVLAPHGYGYVTPMVDSVAYRLTGNGASAYHVIQLLNVIVMASAAFPAYALARRALPHRWSLLVATLTLIVPWMAYSSVVMTEPVFYPVFLLFTLALVRALESPTGSRLVILVLALGLAYASRTQALALAGAIPVAVVLFGVSVGRARAELRAFVPVWLAYGIVGGAAVALEASGHLDLLGHYSVLLNQGLHPLDVLRWTGANVTALTLSLGLLPPIAAVLGVWTLLRRPSADGEAALAAAAAPAFLALLATVVVLSVSPYGLGSTHERNFFVVAPLVFILAIAWALRAGSAPGAAIVILAGLLTVLAVLMPVRVLSPYSESASIRLLSELHYGPSTLAAAMAAAVGLGTLALLRVRGVWPIVFLASLFALAGTAAADGRSPWPRAIAARYTWLDRRLGPDETAMLVSLPPLSRPCPHGYPGSPIGDLSTLTEFFNGSITRVGVIGGASSSKALPAYRLSVRRDGMLSAGDTPLRPRFVVADARLRFVGHAIERFPVRAVVPTAAKGLALAVWSVTPPLRLADPRRVPTAFDLVCRAPPR